MSDTAGCTNPDKCHLPLRIERMSDGGFVVSDTPSFGEGNRFCASLFASTSIGEALAFIAGRLDPETHKAKVLTCGDFEEAARAFAKHRERSPCSLCGMSPKSRCNTCGRGVGVFDPN